MRIGLMLAVLLGATASAYACPSFDFDDVASGGPIILEERIDDGPFKVRTRAVPSNPSLYFHPGEDEGSVHVFVDADTGAPIPFRVVYTGIREYPLRYDLSIEAGTVRDTVRPNTRYEVQPGFTPATHWTSERYGELEIETDAALLRVEEDGRVWTMSVYSNIVRYLRAKNIRITAIYGDRREEVLYESARFGLPEGRDRRVPIAAFALLALLVSVQRRCSPGSRDAFP